MKASTLLYMPLIFLSIVGCKGNKGASQQEKDTLETFNQECYIAIFQKDTAHLNINSLEGSNITGNLHIQYYNNPQNEGKLSGRRIGDTLFADYTYIVGTYKEKFNKNPLAFLVKGDSLILGIGEVETKVGRSYFKPGVPIRFDRGRFRFIKTECDSSALNTN